MAEALRRVEVGFDGGQVIAVRITDEALGSLRDALAGGGWHQLETADDAVDLSLDKVTFVRTAGDGQKVGF